jgi:hypothetical protein
MKADAIPNKHNNDDTIRAMNAKWAALHSGI